MKHCIKINEEDSDIIILDDDDEILPDPECDSRNVESEPIPKPVISNKTNEVRHMRKRKLTGIQNRTKLPPDFLQWWQRKHIKTAESTEITACECIAATPVEPITKAPTSVPGPEPLEIKTPKRQLDCTTTDVQIAVVDCTKRPRNDSDPGLNATKLRPPLVCSSSCSQTNVQAVPLHVAIVPERYPVINIDVALAYHVKDYVLKSIDTLAGSNGPHPAFERLRYRCGALCAQCSDGATSTWLAETVRRYNASTPHCQDVRLRMMPMKDVHNWVRTQLWMPGPYVAPDVILRRIRVQNNMETKWWHVIGILPANRGHLVTIAMDSASWTRIEQLNLVLSLNFSRLAIWYQGIIPVQ